MVGGCDFFAVYSELFHDIGFAFVDDFEFEIVWLAVAVGEEERKTIFPAYSAVELAPFKAPGLVYVGFPVELLDEAQAEHLRRVVAALGPEALEIVHGIILAVVVHFDLFGRDVAIGGRIEKIVALCILNVDGEHVGDVVPYLPFFVVGILTSAKAKQHAYKAERDKSFHCVRFLYSCRKVKSFYMINTETYLNLTFFILPSSLPQYAAIQKCHVG